MKMIKGPKVYKVVINEGFIRSKYDGQRHFIGFDQLCELYGVLKTDIVIRDKGPRGRMSDLQKFEEGWMDLYPRTDGNYCSIHFTDNIDWEATKEGWDKMTKTYEKKKKH